MTSHWRNRYLVIPIFIIFLGLCNGQTPGNGPVVDNDVMTTTTTTTTSEMSTTLSTSTTTTKTTTVASDDEDKPVTWSVPPCLLFRADIMFYIKDSGHTAMVPRNATSSGTCSDFTNKLTLVWDTGNVTLLFIKRPKFGPDGPVPGGSYSLITLYGTVEDPFLNSSDPSAKVRLAAGPGILSFPLDDPYVCNAAETFKGDQTGNITVTFTNLKIEGFRNVTDDAASSTDFADGGSYTSCMKDSALVIAGYTIGAFLVLAIIGMLAYFKYRRSGYEQV